MLTKTTWDRSTHTFSARPVFLYNFWEKSLAGEVRWNYDEPNTLSFYLGRVMKKKVEITPALGLIGNFESYAAVSPQISLFFEKKKFSVFSVTQGSITLKEGSSGYPHFFFHYTEARYHLSDRVRLGIAEQYYTEFQSGTYSFDIGPSLKFFFFEKFYLKLWTPVMIPSKNFFLISGIGVYIKKE